MGLPRLHCSSASTIQWLKEVSGIVLTGDYVSEGYYKTAAEAQKEAVADSGAKRSKRQLQMDAPQEDKAVDKPVGKDGVYSEVDPTRI